MHTQAFTKSKPKADPEPSKIKRKKARSRKAKPTASPLTCDFCGKTYKREKSFLTHLCEKKRRFLAKDDKANRTGFFVFSLFWRLNYRKAKPRTYINFIESTLYNALVSFGKYINDINAVRPNHFIDFLIKAEVPIDRWQSPTVYEAYIRELNKRESPEAALERNLLLMQQWSVETGENWTDFFRKVNPVLATTWIISGRVSPWVLYLAPSAEMLMHRMSEEQLEMIHTTIEPKFWAVKLKAHAKAAKVMREEMTTVGL